MYYLVMMINQDIVGQEYIQSSTRYEDIQSATTAWHTSCASYRNKETTLECTGVILNSIGQPMPHLTDHYEKRIPTPEPETDEQR